MNKDIFGSVLVALFIGLAIGTFFGGWMADSGLREKAVRVGVAYYTNNAAGESIFVWKGCK